jgi:hypothetical protein
MFLHEFNEFFKAFTIPQLVLIFARYDDPRLGAWMRLDHIENGFHLEEIRNCLVGQDVDIFVFYQPVKLDLVFILKEFLSYLFAVVAIIFE